MTSAKNIMQGNLNQTFSFFTFYNLWNLNRFIETKKTRSFRQTSSQKCVKYINSFRDK